MKSPLLILGLLGIGAYGLSQKPKVKLTTEKSEKTETEEEDKLPEVEKELPSVDESDDDKPGVEDKEPSEPEDNSNKFPWLAELADPLLINNNEFPSNFGTDLLWISDSCQSWAVGKDFLSNVTLPEKYLYHDPVNPNELVTPSQWWAKIGDNISPSPWYINNIPTDTPGRAFAANVIDIWRKYHKCNISPPHRSQFKTFSEYEIILNKFISTPLGKLFDYLSLQIQEQMYASWSQKYPSQATIEVYKGWALDAVVKYPSETSGKQTDIAYAWIFQNNPDAPKKIDVKNPKHKFYLSAWQRINIEVKNYRGLIKQYGAP